jgi:hypothetical protein
VDQQVDVISMSFAILETSGLLDTTISNTNAQGIVLLCSTHDEGSNVGKAWPADFSETFAITACDEYGAQHRAIDEESYKCKLQGLNLAAGAIPFPRVDGSHLGQLGGDGHCRRPQLAHHLVPAPRQPGADVRGRPPGQGGREEAG